MQKRPVDEPNAFLKIPIKTFTDVFWDRPYLPTHRRGRTPDKLYQVTYEAAGEPEMAHLTRNLIGRAVNVDNSRGIDQITWSVLCHMYSKADIRVYQLSVDNQALAFYTPDHFFPLLYVLGASGPDDALAVSSQICTMGFMSMTCYLFQ